MDLEEYARHARRTRNVALDYEDNVRNAVMGLVGEAAECLELVKKHAYQGHPLDTVKLAEEVGDVAWYLWYVADVLGVPVADLLQANIQKLQRRYPDRFTAQASVARIDTDQD